MTTQPGAHHAGSQLLPVADVTAKVVVVLLLVLVVLDPEWGNLEGKAPVARALVYPLVALVVPLLWALRGARPPYPWGADLMVTLTCFSDVLGNRLDLFDQVVWFDDWMHFMNNALVSTAIVVLTLPRTAGRLQILERSVAAGMTVGLAWEAFEYVSFVTRSAEFPTAYADTMGDLVLGWLGSVAAALVVAALWREDRAATHRPDEVGRTALSDPRTRT